MSSIEDTPSITKEDIVAKRHELAEMIRAYCRSQRELWQQIPWLALQAAGGAGRLNDELTRYYTWGLYALEPLSSASVYQCYVDLATGELVYGPEDMRLVVEEAAVVDINLGTANASQLVESLKEHAKNSSFHHGEKVKQWRAQTADWFELAEGKPYERVVPVVSFDFAA